MNRARLPIPILLVAIVAIVAVVATSGASTNKAHSTAAPGSAVALKQTALGGTLVDANGRTLYLFQGDRPNVSRLTAAGQAVWPRFTASVKPQATGGAAAARIGTIPASTGSAQVTYNGHPLYYYVGDQKPGQTAGQGLNEFGGRWYVLSAQGVAVTSAAASAAPSTPAGRGSSSSGSSYGY